MAIKTLVVDNNPVLLKAVSAILGQEGFEVKSAGTGLEALEILEDYEPEIVFTDLIMPLVSGEQLCRILRNTKKHEHIFIVVISATILEDQARITQDIKCDFCIAKGNLQEMRQHIREALKTYSQRKITSQPENQKNAHIPSGLRPSTVTSELLSEKRHLAMMLANLDEGILELSGSGKIITVNRAALEILSCKEEQLVGMAFTKVIDWGDLCEPIQRWTKEQLLEKGLGSYKIVEKFPLHLKDRVLVGSLMAVADAADVFGLCILRDITRQYQAEQHNKELDNAIKLVKKMDAMSCMAGGVAHDFNNLLTVICGNLDVLAYYSKQQSYEDRANLLDQARKAALVAVDLTRQISCFSNFGIVSRETIGIGQLVRKATEKFYDKELGDYSISVHCDDCLVYVDPEEIGQALANVLKNGLEASDGGKIEISIDICTFDVPRLMSGQYVSAGNYVQIAIRDFGKGIEHEQIFRIFDPYYSTKERGAVKGMGLGLTVVYATLRNHGGHVVVHSQGGVGTTVSLYLPVVHSKRTEIPLLQSAAVVKQQVLLIEADEQMGEIGRIMLEHLGYGVVWATCRAEAMQEMQRFVDNAKLSRPMIILDLGDSGGESAIETCRLLLAMDKTLQIIAMSGTILHPVMEDCRKYGFVNTLAKPYSMDSLRHVTGMVLQN